MKDVFVFKLGEIHKGEYGYETTYHAELKNGLYHITWENMKEEFGEDVIVTYTKEQVKNAIIDGSWIIIDEVIKEVFVIAYYGSVYSKQYSNTLGWRDVYIGEGIIHESKHLNYYPTPADRFIKHHAPKDKEYKYAKIEKRFYPTNV
jgi:hypothetical protein